FYATIHNQNFHIGTRVKALVFKEKNISRNIRLFFVVAINRLQIKFIEYSANATDKLSNERISVPVYQNNQIAFDFMEDFIKSIEKAHIDNIYRFWQNKLSAYKDVVAGSGG
uniref:restriction endonuclease subunit S n=1 Tax=Helicobacter typhlonius TaxID=76936 RepID=UPI002FDFAD25